PPAPPHLPSFPTRRSSDLAERALAAELGVSRAALRQALAVLEEGGLVRRVPGRGGGTFVSKGKIERDLSRVVGVPALLRSQGVRSEEHTSELQSRFDLVCR